MDDNAEEYMLLHEPDETECPACFGPLDEDGECDWCYRQEVSDDVGFMYEHDSAMASVGWGTDEDYGYYGNEEF